MDSELGQAFYTVYTSSKQILKNNNQRHLFCNTLDLLTSSCKTAGMNCYLISNNDLIKFWLSDVLPLMFDSDRTIQNSAVAAMEQALIGLQISDVHSSSHWPELKVALITKYAPQINALRESKISQWHKIWCILICLLDREILRGASVINSFLSIVELGFRNMDNTVRAEAFLCWRLLIKIFSAYDELGSPKRLKLICIPLKSSQSKTAHAATVKFRTWWYLLTCLSKRLVENFDNVVEPFLVFAFGTSVRSNTQGVAQQYRSAFALALPGLVTLLSLTSPSEQLQRIMREQQLEQFVQPSLLITREVLKQHWRLILNAVMEAIKLHHKHETLGNTTEAEQQLLHMLLRNLTQAMINQHVAPFSTQMCVELEKLLPDQSRPVLTVFNTIATEQLSLHRNVDNVEDYKAILGAFMQLCIKAKSEVPPSILQRGICHIYSTESLHAETQGDFRLLTSILELVLLTSDEDSYDTFEVKLIIWRQLSHAVIDYLRINSLDYRLKHNAQLLDRWLLWPLQTYASFAGRRNSAIFDSTFCELWRHLLNAGHNSLERKKFVTDIQTSLIELLKCRKEDAYFAELFDCYVTAVLKLGIAKDSPLQREAFPLLKELLNQQNLAQKTLEGCLNSLRNVFIGLKNNEITVIYDELKPLLSLILQTWKKHNFEGPFLIEWKRTLQDKLRTHPNKNLATQLKELFKGNDVFVIIPTVWSLNPEKLTDRQKERFAEKSDIPALYNDMTQSQDSSIKPWTPKKIVIAKNNQAEIAIEDNERFKTIENDNDSDILNKSTNLDTTQRRTRNTTSKTPNTTEFILPNKSNNEDANIREKRKTRATTEEIMQGPILRRFSIDEAALNARLTRQRNVRKDIIEKPELEKKTTSTANKLPSKQQQSTSPLKMQRRNSTFRELFADSGSSHNESCAESAHITPSLTHDVVSKSHADAETELNTQYIENVSPTEPMAAIDAPKENNETTATELATIQETSPKKPTTRFSGLTSPPDRKLTNNSTSPTLRPKPTAHLTGRGAQLINMIRNKKFEVQSSYPPLASSFSRNTLQISTPARNVERAETSTPTTELFDLTGTDQASTPMQLPKELLTFSKRLPSPSASPSASILKRKMRYDSIDESIESPAFKRKRVSFHDPPVSVTKEYLRDSDENRSKPKRCLILDKSGQISTTPEIKHVLRRRSRIDSILEIEKYGTADHQTAIIRTPTEVCASSSASRITEVNTICTEDGDNTNAEDDSICTLKWHDSRNSTANDSGEILKSASKAPQMDDTVATTSAPTDTRALAIVDNESALNVVLEQCSLESVLEKYFSVKPNSSNTGPVKNANVLAKFMSHQMNSNPKIKTTILEILSENHSKDFLDHAVQENLSSVVCDRLNLNSVLDYICSKSKINTSCRNNLLAQVPDIICSSKVETERLNFIENLLRNSNFSDDNILDIMAMLMRARERREFNIESVSESAVDSSSNL